jgi:hypothetical protein
MLGEDLGSGCNQNVGTTLATATLSGTLILIMPST